MNNHNAINYYVRLSDMLSLAFVNVVILVYSNTLEISDKIVVISNMPKLTIKLSVNVEKLQ